MIDDIYILLLFKKWFITKINDKHGGCLMMRTKRNKIGGGGTLQMTRIQAYKRPTMRNSLTYQAVNC